MSFSETQIRNKVIQFFKPNSFRTEFCFGGSRFDLLLEKDGAIIGVEIKTDKDSFVRLRGQLSDYTRFCDFVFLAVETKKIPKWLPTGTGVLRVGADNVWAESASYNFSKTNFFSHSITLACIRETLGRSGFKRKHAKIVRNALSEFEEVIRSLWLNQVFGFKEKYWLETFQKDRFRKGWGWKFVKQGFMQFINNRSGADCASGDWKKKPIFVTGDLEEGQEEMTSYGPEKIS